MVTNQHVVMIDKSSIEIDAVICVREFDEEGVLLETSLGHISIEGRDLKIENFEKAASKILITGDLRGVSYLERHPRKKSRGVVN